ncbi:putative acetyl esterase [Thermoclostridium stercorarium subsp. stercorarium DSM 8532]|uniref:Acetylesterase n=3 Tax=Thermoclostridium stercorarium TaxID=1510 RepID=A0A1B1YKD6_THEST|nr:alpha/beta hydrolase [Thermoclostridium stercorarium]AGC68299.1 putative acetyl esterase [Thermoclostridium stercorarium subsp. stercorarium DSM 8532]AGI39327.1 esterase [Thermoclostridium stercorarium subsp. stercorarium DSM 8532]ANW98652.1 acetylesterase [Thermoclostridium stercorarium subsp. thermolacticum DSM 2910]ANX01194.1 acetylesterase [Thermoclostridium stercorarium subsp. leptospartum DSM 9219]
MINRKIKIWDGILTKNELNGFEPCMETYILSGEKKRGAVLICPGGGYTHTSPREAEPIAMRFTAKGYHAFILYYSVAPNRHPQPLLDVSRAMCIIRENADEWNVDRNKIAVCGFSAGGHLAASLGVHYDKPYLKREGIVLGENRPNALILGYPVITMKEFAHKGSRDNLLGENPDDALINEMSLENHVSEKTPPAFIWHTVEDRSVPVENSLLFAMALHKNKIPFELHIYPYGPHGLSLANKETDNGNMGEYPHVSGWIDLCIEWLDGIFSQNEKF